MSFTHLKYTWSSLGTFVWLRPFRWVKQHPFWAGVLFIGGLAYANCLPEPLFDDPVSTVLVDRHGALLGGRIATDGQWRFPPLDTVPSKFAQAIMTFEDKRFYYHPGVDPLAMLRALWLNLSRGEIVSGGSTLSMQVIRLARKNKGRTLWEKLVEIIWATRLELREGKGDILGLYASHAPFGGNVVGLHAAAWKYYARPPEALTWSEAATLAVLPNAPSLIHPGKNRDLLRAKRDLLLGHLLGRGLIDSTDWELALLEPLPDQPKPLPQLAPHLLDKAVVTANRSNHTLRQTTLERATQLRVNEIVARYHQSLIRNGIHNAAVVVAEVETGAVRAYVGNTPGDDSQHGHAVDIIPARRSTGSIMKPFLYAAMLSDGKILPHTLVPDVPSYFGSYHPENFEPDYQGAIPASRALARSLNVPAVHMLQQYGIPRFYEKLKRMGMNTLDQGPYHYGLTLVLGGAEGSLWNLTGIYAGMARTLNRFSELNSRYDPHAYEGLHVFPSDQVETLNLTPQPFGPLSAGAIWLTFEAMVEVARPSHESSWRQFSSSGRIAWKTGTSYGFRDAWAIGLTPEYVVGVWVGNADGEGRPGLVGVQAAAPILFDIFDGLAEGERWFYPPFDDLREQAVCSQSGHQPSRFCTDLDTLWVPKQGQHTTICPYHQLISLDKTNAYRVNGHCESPMEMNQTPFFVLPTLESVYYRNHHPDFVPLPPWRPDCRQDLNDQVLAFVYPKPGAQIYIPVELDETSSQTVFEVAHQDPESIVYWHVDEHYLGATKHIHQMALHPNPGIHEITVVDQQGRRLTRSFEILAQAKNTP